MSGFLNPDLYYSDLLISLHFNEKLLWIQKQPSAKENVEVSDSHLIKQTWISYINTSNFP